MPVMGTGPVRPLVKPAGQGGAQLGADRALPDPSTLAVDAEGAGSVRRQMTTRCRMLLVSGSLRQRSTSTAVLRSLPGGPERRRRHPL